MGDALNLVGLLAVAALFGAMVFFSFVLAPLVFARLEAATAAGFMRDVFPWYYGVVIALSLLAMVTLAVGRALEAALMGLVLVGGVVARQVLMPRINGQRERAREGDVTAQRTFTRLHRLSVAINLAQIAAAVAALLRLGAP